MITPVSCRLVSRSHRSGKFRPVPFRNEPLSSVSKVCFPLLSALAYSLLVSWTLSVDVGVTLADVHTVSDLWTLSVDADQLLAILVGTVQAAQVVDKDALQWKCCFCGQWKVVVAANGSATMCMLRC